MPRNLRLAPVRFWTPGFVLAGVLLTALSLLPPLDEPDWTAAIGTRAIGPVPALLVALVGVWRFAVRRLGAREIRLGPVVRLPRRHPGLPSLRLRPGATVWLQRLRTPWGEAVAVTSGLRWPAIYTARDLGGTPLAELESALRRALFVRDRAPLGWWPPPATLALMALVVAGFLVDHLRAEADHALPGVGTGAMVNGLVAEGDWGRLLSAAFVHVDWDHAASNVVGLLLAGWVAERVLGGALLLVLALGASTAGMLYFLSQSVAPYSYVLGASGIVYGLGGAALVAWCTRARRLSVLHRTGAVALALAALVLWDASEGWSPRLHRASLVAGVGLAALLQPLAARCDLSAAWRRGVHVAGAIVACLVLAALAEAWWLRDAASIEATRLRVLGWSFAEDVHPDQLNEAAWEVAVAPRSTPQELEVAHRLARLAHARDRSEVAYRDTLATVLYRLGDTAAALAVQRPLIGLENGDFLATQYARFGLAHFRRHGLVHEGIDPEARVELEAVDGARVVLEASEAVPAGAVVEALWLGEDEELVGLLVIALDGETGPREAQVALDLPRRGRLEVVRLAAPEGRVGDEVTGSWWNADPEVLALP